MKETNRNDLGEIVLPGVNSNDELDDHDDLTFSQEESATSKKQNIPTSSFLRSLTEEDRIANELKATNLPADVDKHLECIAELGEIYRRRSNTKSDKLDYTRAAGLYNYAINVCRSRCKGDKENDAKYMGKISEFEDIIAEIEMDFIRTITQNSRVNVASFVQERKDKNHNDRKLLKQIRDEARKNIKQLDSLNHELDEIIKNKNKVETHKQELKIAGYTKDIYQRIANQTKHLIHSMVDDCIEVLGPAPCNYAIIGLGSFARGELTPYSDLECAILIDDVREDVENPEDEEKVNTNDAKEYFRLLNYYLHFKIVGLGETILPILSIDSLNKIKFYDNITPRGFTFDALLPEAYKWPLGRQNMCNDKGEKLKDFELIGTTEELAKYQTAEGYEYKLHLAEVLASAEIITSNNKDQGNALLAKYHKLVSAKLAEKSASGLEFYKQRGLDLLKEDIKQYQPIKKGEERVIWNAKKEIYRFPEVVLEGICLYHNIRKNNAWDKIEELQKLNIINKEAADNLKIALGIATEIRLRTYLASNKMADDVEVNKPFNQSSKEQVQKVFNISKERLQRYYHTVLPLYNRIEEFLEAEQNQSSNMLSNMFGEGDHLYDDGYENQGLICYKLMDYEGANTFLKISRKHYLHIEEVYNSSCALSYNNHNKQDSELIRQTLTKQLKKLYKAQDTIPKLIEDESVPIQKIDEYYVELQILLDNKEKGDRKPIQSTQIFDQVGDQCASDKVLILGKAGVGKTTLLHYISYEWSKGKLFNDKFDHIFRIKLKLLLDSDLSRKLADTPRGERLAKLIQLSIEQQQSEIQLIDDIPLSYIISADKKRTLLLLDGYDEIIQLVSKTNNVVYNDIIRMIFDGYNIVMTSRPNALSSDLDSKFNRKIENTGLTYLGARKYISKYFSNQKTRPQNVNVTEVEVSLIKLLDSNPTLGEIITTPINVAMLCLICSKSDFVEKFGKEFNAGQLYYEAIVWLGKRYIDKFQIQHLRIQNIIPARIFGCNQLKVLQQVAYTQFKEGKAIDGEFLDECAMGYGTTIEEVIQIGLLKSDYTTSVNLIKQNYSFIHLSFQEYLTAYSLKEHLLDPAVAKEMATFIANHRSEPRWHMVLKYLSGILANEKSKSGDRAIQIYWEAISCNIDGVLEFAVNRKVALLMHLLAQSRINGELDRKIPNLDIMIGLIDKVVIDGGIVSWSNEIIASGYTSRKIQNKVLEIIDEGVKRSIKLRSNANIEQKIRIKSAFKLFLTKIKGEHDKELPIDLGEFSEEDDNEAAVYIGYNISSAILSEQRTNKFLESSKPNIELKFALSLVIHILSRMPQKGIDQLLSGMRQLLSDHDFTIKAVGLKAITEILINRRSAEISDHLQAQIITLIRDENVRELAVNSIIVIIKVFNQFDVKLKTMGLLLLLLKKSDGNIRRIVSKIIDVIIQESKNPEVAKAITTFMPLLKHENKIIKDSAVKVICQLIARNKGFQVEGETMILLIKLLHSQYQDLKNVAVKAICKVVEINNDFQITTEIITSLLTTLHTFDISMSSVVEAIGEVVQVSMDTVVAAQTITALNALLKVNNRTLQILVVKTIYQIVERIDKPDVIKEAMVVLTTLLMKYYDNIIISDKDLNLKHQTIFYERLGSTLFPNEITIANNSSYLSRVVVYDSTKLSMLRGISRTFTLNKDPYVAEVIYEVIKAMRIILTVSKDPDIAIEAITILVSLLRSDDEYIKHALVETICKIVVASKNFKIASKAIVILIPMLKNDDYINNKYNFEIRFTIRKVIESIAIIVASSKDTQVAKEAIIELTWLLKTNEHVEVLAIMAVAEVLEANKDLEIVKEAMTLFSSIVGDKNKNVRSAIAGVIGKVVMLSKDYSVIKKAIILVNFLLQDDNCYVKNAAEKAIYEVAESLGIIIVVSKDFAAAKEVMAKVHLLLKNNQENAICSAAIVIYKIAIAIGMIVMVSKDSVCKIELSKEVDLLLKMYNLDIESLESRSIHTVAKAIYKATEINNSENLSQTIKTPFYLKKNMPSTFYKSNTAVDLEALPRIHSILSKKKIIMVPFVKQLTIKRNPSTSHNNSGRYQSPGEIISDIVVASKNPHITNEAMMHLIQLLEYGIDAKSMAIETKHKLITLLEGGKDVRNIAVGTQYKLELAMGKIKEPNTEFQIANKEIIPFNHLFKDDGFVKSLAIKAIGQIVVTIDQVPQEVMIALNHLLTSKESRVKSAAAEVIGLVVVSSKDSQATKESIIQLSPLLQDEDMSVRDSVSNVLATIIKKLSVFEIAHYLTTNEFRLRKIIISSLIHNLSNIQLQQDFELIELLLKDIIGYEDPQGERKELIKVAQQTLKQQQEYIDNKLILWVTENFHELFISSNEAKSFLKVIYHKLLSAGKVSQNGIIYIIKCIKNGFTTSIMQNQLTQDYKIIFEDITYSLIGKQNRKYLEQISEEILNQQDDYALRYRDFNPVFVNTGLGIKIAATDIRYVTSVTSHGSINNIINTIFITRYEWQVSFMQESDNAHTTPENLFMLLEKRDVFGNHVMHKIHANLSVESFVKHPEEVDTEFCQKLFGNLVYNHNGYKVYYSKRVTLNDQEKEDLFNALAAITNTVEYNTKFTQNHQKNFNYEEMQGLFKALITMSDIKTLASITLEWGEYINEAGRCYQEDLLKLPHKEYTDQYNRRIFMDLKGPSSQIRVPTNTLSLGTIL